MPSSRPVEQPKPQAQEKKSQPGKPPEQTEPLAVLERKLTGNDGWIESVAISPDGRWLAACGQRAHTLVKIWDQAGEYWSTLEKHTASVREIGFISDAAQLISGSEDESIQIWETSTFQQISRWIWASRLSALFCLELAEAFLWGLGFRTPIMGHGIETLPTTFHLRI